MITRIVKLHFQQEQLPSFLAHFETVKHKVSKFAGCHGMKLLQDIHDPCLVMTYSAWENEEALENYRNSELFGTIWPTIKVWFDQKPEAWTVETYFNGFPELIND